MTTMNTDSTIVEQNVGDTTSSSEETSKSPNPTSEEIKQTDETKKETQIPYKRFSQVVDERNTERLEKEALQKEIQLLKSSIDKGSKLSVEQNEQIASEIPEEIKELFGDDAERGGRLLHSWLKKAMDIELTAKQKIEFEQNLQKSQELEISNNYIKTETERVMEEFGIVDVNRFHDSIKAFAAKEGDAIRKNGKFIDFNTHAILFLAQNPKTDTVKKPANLEKIAGKTITKTTAERWYSPKDFRR
jgi:hypothetical protein